MRKLGKLGAAAIGVLAGVGTTGAQGQTTISVNPTIGSQNVASTTVNVVGNTYQLSGNNGITVGGTQRFYSLGTFSIGAGDTAAFIDLSGIKNVIARVTDGASTINGRIQASNSVDKTNVFLMNPAGIMFGATASLDVSGSFHATTADYISLGSGSDRFYADPNKGSTLTAADPTAFGFLSPNSAQLRIDQATLSAGSGNALTFVATDLRLDRARIDAPSGSVSLAAIAAGGEYNLAGGAATDGGAGEVLGSRISANGSGGKIQISGGAFQISNSMIESNDSSGSIKVVLGGNLALDQSAIKSRITSTFAAGTPARVDVTAKNIRMVSSIISSTNGDLQATGNNAGPGAVSIIAKENIHISGGEGGITRQSVATSATGPSGAGSTYIEGRNIVFDNGALVGTNNADSLDALVTGSIGIVAHDTLVLDNAQVRSQFYAGPPLGSISIQAGSMRMANGAQIDGRVYAFSTSKAGGQGAPINLTVARDLSLDAAKITSDASLACGGCPSSGNQGQPPTIGGQIQVKVDGSLSLVRGAQISSSATDGTNAGTVAVNVKGHTVVDGVSTGIFSNATAGTQLGGDRDSKAGSVTLSSGSLLISNGGALSSSTSSAGNAGEVRVVSSGSFSVLGQGSTISATSSGSGNAGSVTVNAVALNVVDGGTIISTSTSSGNGGSVITTSTGATTLSGTRTTIEARATGSGNAGSVNVTGSSINLTDGATISSAASSGSGGSVAVVASGSVSLAGAGTTIEATSTGAGNAGSVGVTAGTISLANGAVISSSASSSASGNGGNVTTTSTGATTLSGTGTAIAASATGTGAGGNITITANELVLNDGAKITSSTASGNAGDISIFATKLVYLTRSQITTSAGGGQGTGGNIFIDPEFVILNQSQIRADAKQGSGGNIKIIAKNFLKSVDSVVSASSESGVSGTVTVTAPDTDLIAGLAELPDGLSSTAKLDQRACVGPNEAPTLSLVPVGRGGLTLVPESGQAQPAFLVAGRASRAAKVAAAAPGQEARQNASASGPQPTKAQLAQFAALPMRASASNCKANG